MALFEKSVFWQAQVQVQVPGVSRSIESRESRNTTSKTGCYSAVVPPAHLIGSCRVSLLAMQTDTHQADVWAKRGPDSQNTEQPCIIRTCLVTPNQDYSHFIVLYYASRIMLGLDYCPFYPKIHSMWVLSQFTNCSGIWCLFTHNVLIWYIYQILLNRILLKVRSLLLDFLQLRLDFCDSHLSTPEDFSLVVKSVTVPFPQC